MITVINNDNFDSEVMAYSGKVLLDFWAEWCAPCMMLSPIVDELSEEMEDVKFCKVNCDDNRSLAMQFGIMSIPTLLVFENGEIVNKSIGLVEKEDIIELLK